MLLSLPCLSFQQDLEHQAQKCRVSPAMTLYLVKRGFSVLKMFKNLRYSLYFYLRSPFDSILAVVFTVSPKRQYLGIL